MTRTEEMSIRIHDAIHSGHRAVVPMDGMVEQPIVTRGDLRTVIMVGKQGLTEWQEQSIDPDGPHVEFAPDGKTVKGRFFVTMALHGHYITRIIRGGKLGDAGIIDGIFTQNLLETAREIGRGNVVPVQG